MNLGDGPRGITMCLSKAGLAIGDGSKLGVAIASTVGSGVDYVIDGVIRNLADAATDKPLSADTVTIIQPVLTKCLYLICVSTAGAVTSVMGKPVLTAKLTAGTDVLHWPQPTAGTCPIGAVLMTVASTATFTPGTTALDATNCTAAYYNLATVPSAPMTFTSAGVASPVI